MTSRIVRRLLLVGSTLALITMPAVARAQEATVNGTVTDSTGGVLPGVTIKAVNAASGNSFESVTDARGAYLLAVRIGLYQITATLTGFGTVSRNLELQVGQTTVVNLRMSLSAVQESVTVTGEAPLIETSTSSVAGNIDPRQGPVAAERDLHATQRLRRFADSPGGHAAPAAFQDGVPSGS